MDTFQCLHIMAANKQTGKPFPGPNADVNNAFKHNMPRILGLPASLARVNMF